MDRVAVRKDREPIVPPEGIKALQNAAVTFITGETKHFDRLREIQHPALIVSGDQDNFFPVKNQWLLFRELPNAQLAVYPQAGHGPHQQHPKTVAAQIERFLTHA
jgi:pimeloyl-ACP methyl ester carboxylesterase